MDLENPPPPLESAPVLPSSTSPAQNDAPMDLENPPPPLESAPVLPSFTSPAPNDAPMVSENPPHTTPAPPTHRRPEPSLDDDHDNEDSSDELVQNMQMPPAKYGHDYQTNQDLQEHQELSMETSKDFPWQSTICHKSSINFYFLVFITSNRHHLKTSLLE